jgi:hypothetical protein
MVKFTHRLKSHEFEKCQNIIIAYILACLLDLNFKVSLIDLIFSSIVSKLKLLKIDAYLA